MLCEQGLQIRAELGQGQRVDAEIREGAVLLPGEVIALDEIAEATQRTSAGAWPFVGLMGGALQARPHGQLVVQPELAGLRAPDLPRGGLGNAARRREHDGVWI